jgi:ribosomal protein L40E
MIVCPACDHQNPEGAQTCETCGAPLIASAFRACPSCGALNAVDNAFCRRCLSALDAHRQALLAQAEEEPLPSEPRSAPEAPAVQAPSALQEQAPEQTHALTPPVAAPKDAVGPSPARSRAPEVKAPAPSPVSDKGRVGDAVELVQPIEALEGLEDVLPAEAVLAIPYRAMVARSAADQKDLYDAELLRQVASSPIPLLLERQAPAATARTPSAWLRWLGHSALYLLVLLAALLPLISRGQSSSLVRPRYHILELARALDSLPPGSTVLVSFDYGPTYAGEMDVLAQAVIRQLASRSIRLVGISTKPAGLGLAQANMDGIAAEQPAYRYGVDYVLLGYLPGQEVGLRALHNDLRGAFKIDHVQGLPLADLPIMSQVHSLHDVSAVLLLADDQQTVRQWVEQVGSREEITLYALVTAAIEPLLTPYRQSGQLANLVGGATGAAEYAVASGGQVAALDLADGYAALFVVLVLIAVITNAVFISGGDGKARQPR